jgi:hypothetical protein
MIAALVVLAVAATSLAIGYKIGAHDALESAQTVILKADMFDLPLKQNNEASTIR